MKRTAEYGLSWAISQGWSRKRQSVLIPPTGSRNHGDEIAINPTIGVHIDGYALHSQAEPDGKEWARGGPCFQQMSKK
jgi:hypothetical protein